ncbi:MAG: hypothetical protein QW614_04000 [Candidatus Caldarchaeum sp.]|uniref:Uncharacterized protein n=1 Tax=Caldiarchaeum subterraneum TaxID=311458 RepID=A0A7C5LD84_CALS0
MRWLVLVVLLSLPMLAALPPPRLLNIPFQGTVARVDSDGGNLLAIAFADRNLLGLYFADAGSYVEIPVDSPVVKTVFPKGKAVALLSPGDRLAVIDVASKKATYVSLETTATTIAADLENVYVAYARAGKIDKLSADGLQPVETISSTIASGPDYVSVHGGVVWTVSPTLNTVSFHGKDSGNIVVDGAVNKILAVKDGAWLVLTDDTVVKVSGTSIVYKTTLPRATFVTSVTALDDKLVYSSVSRRVVGVVDQTGYREVSMPSFSPSSVAAGSDRRIWFLDTASNSVGYTFDSDSPKILDWSIKRLEDGSAEVRARVSDPEGDLASVLLVALEYGGVFPLGPVSTPMNSVQGVYVGTYRPSGGVTRAELYVNATDAAGNQASQKIGEVDYRASNTSPVITTQTGPAPQIGGGALTSLAAELLLLVPLMLVATFLVVNRRRKRKPRKKK